MFDGDTARSCQYLHSSVLSVLFLVACMLSLGIAVHIICFFLNPIAFYSIGFIFK